MDEWRQTLLALKRLGCFGAICVILSGCASAPKPLLVIESSKTYQAAFAQVKAHILQCFPKAKIRSNLYNDVPEAEIILDYIPGATYVGLGSSYETSREIFHLHFIGDGLKSKVTATNQKGADLVKQSFSDQPCAKLG